LQPTLPDLSQSHPLKNGTHHITFFQIAKNVKRDPVKNGAMTALGLFEENAKRVRLPIVIPN
jgi:hypothetical protein